MVAFFVMKALKLSSHPSNALPDPGTMVVESLHTVIADAAVRAARWPGATHSGGEDGTIEQ